MECPNHKGYEMPALPQEPEVCKECGQVKPVEPTHFQCRECGKVYTAGDDGAPVEVQASAPAPAAPAPKGPTAVASKPSAP